MKLFGQRTPLSASKILTLLSLCCSNIAFAAAPVQTPAEIPSDDQGFYASGRLLVKGKPGLSEKRFQGILSKHNAKSQRSLDKLGVHVVDVPKGQEKRLLALLASEPDMDFVELDRFVAPSAIPNDPAYSSQWHHGVIGTAAAWDSANASNVTIAILDTGVTTNHPDLAAALLPGYNVVSQNSDISDLTGHGTKTSGTAAAIVNNGEGVSGVAYGAKILPVRITNDPSSYAYWSDIANGITWAADHGAKVVSNSYASYTGSSVSQAAAYLRNKGGIFFCSAGNDGAQIASNADANVVVVGATDQYDARAYFSNYGSFLDLVAPGVGIWTTDTSGGYSNPSGTSFSTPLAAGVAALVYGVNPQLKPADVEAIMKNSAKDLADPGYDIYYGSGRIDAAAAVALAKTYKVDTTPPTASITSPASGATVAGVVSVNVTAADDVGVSRVELLVNNALYATDSTAPYSFSWDSTSLGNTKNIALKAVAYDAAGNSSASSISVNAANLVDTTSPVVTISAPLDGRSVSGMVGVKASATDNVAVSSMSIYIDGNRVATATGSKVSYSWNTRKISKGTHYVTVSATDSSGNVGQSLISVVK